MKSRITFNGMNRYSPPNSAQPGDCTAIVNLRNQSNCLKPVGTPEYLYTPEKKNHWLVYVHICYDGEHHITENENTLYYEALIKKENGNIQKESSLLFELNDLQVLSIQSIGNTLIIICTESIYYLLYKEGKYIFLGEKPDIPGNFIFPLCRIYRCLLRKRIYLSNMDTAIRPDSTPKTSIITTMLTTMHFFSYKKSMETALFHTTHTHTLYPHFI